MSKADSHCVCGCALIDEATSGDPAQRRPCPQCGSLARVISIEAVTASFHLTGGIPEIAVVTYPEALLAACRGLISDRQYGISVVVAHMACEVSVERTLSAAFASKGLQYLEDPILDLLNGYNLANSRNRKLYTSLTGDNVEQQIFWQEFKESATRRNNIVHGGSVIDQEDAERSYRAATAFISHLNQVERLCLT